MSIFRDLAYQFRTNGIVTKLIFCNVALFVVPELVFGLMKLLGHDYNYLHYVSISSVPTEMLWKPWSVVSYAFFHSGVFHLLFNMVMLNFAGLIFLTFFNQKQLLNLYFVGAIFSGVVYIFMYSFLPKIAVANTTTGASGAVMAILFATTTCSPYMNLRLLIFGNVKLWHIALALILLELFMLSTDKTGSQLVHLGGALFGYLYTTQIKKGRDICLWFGSIVAVFAPDTYKRKNHFRKIHRTYNLNPKKKTVSKIVIKDKRQEQIDKILDKISDKGYDSLSQEEKEFLFRNGE